MEWQRQLQAPQTQGKHGMAEMTPGIANSGELMGGQRRLQALQMVGKHMEWQRRLQAPQTEGEHGGAEVTACTANRKETLGMVEANPGPRYC